jgi:DNA polymerase delta subunit 3
MNWWRIYGSIQNPYVKVQSPTRAPNIGFKYGADPPLQRRTAKSVPPPVAPATTKPAAKPVAKSSFGTATAAQGKAKDTESTTSKDTAAEDNAASRSAPQSIASNPTLKRSDSKSGNKKSQSVGDLFKSFAKAKPKTKDAEKSKESTPAADGKYI